MARRSRQTSMMSLDSLLDTITNVVGFLVIVLVVVQLNVSFAEPAQPPPPPPPTRPRPDDGERQKDMAKKLKELRARLEALLQQIQEKDEQLKENPDVRGLMADQDALEERMRNLLAEIERIREAIKQAQQALTDIGRKVKEAEKRGDDVPDPKQEVLPKIRIVETYEKGDPKPDWLDKKRLLIVCRRGRAFHMQVEQLGRAEEKAIRKCLKIRAGKKIKLTSVAQFHQLKEYFDKHDVGDKNIRIKLAVIKFITSVTLRPRYEFRNDRLGETTQRIVGGKSDLAKLLNKTNRPAKAWVRFLVWDDSFDTYRAARAIADEGGYAVGWVPFERDETLKGGGGGGPIIGPGG